MSEVRIGTCSWMDRSLVASGWYPKSAKDPEDKLKFYSQHFDTVEVDSSFYAIPREKTIYAWALRTPPDFLFNVKAFGLFTFHAVSIKSLPPEIRAGMSLASRDRVKLFDLERSVRSLLWEVFYRRIYILHNMGRLGYLLFQFPPWFKYEDKTLEYLRFLAKKSRPFKVAVEIRHRSWLEDDSKATFLKLLEDENMAYVAVDEPKLVWTVPFEWHVTASWGTVLRLHGRNSEAWMKKNISVAERFAYRYDETELRSIAEEVAARVEQVPSAYVMFNNCFRDFAVKNALQMKRYLGMEGGNPLEGEQKNLPMG